MTKTEYQYLARYKRIRNRVRNIIFNIKEYMDKKIYIDDIDDDLAKIEYEIEYYDDVNSDNNHNSIYCDSLEKLADELFKFYNYSYELLEHKSAQLNIHLFSKETEDITETINIMMLKN